MGIQQIIKTIITQGARKARYAAQTGFGTKSELSMTLKQFNMPTVFATDIEQIGNKTVRNCFSNYALGFCGKSINPNFNNLLTQLKPKDELWRMQEIVQKLNMCADKRIKNEAELILLNAKTESVHDFRQAFDKVEQLLDCANTMEGNYSSLYRNASIADDAIETIPVLKLNIKKLKAEGNQEELEKSLKELEEYKNYAYSDARKLSKPITVKNELNLDFMPEVVNTNIEKEVLKYIAKNQDIKEYISTAAKGDTIADALYRTYLETQPKEIRYKLEDIFYRFRIHTFVDNGADKNTLSKLKRLEYELEQQLKTSEGKAEFPNLVDLTKYDPYSLTNSCGGYTYRGGKYCSKISINDNDNEIAELYRHESIHFHDKTIGNERPTFSEASKKDFFNSNLTIDNILQIHESRAEKIAHSAKLDMAKVSQKTKEELINDGLKPFYTKMESITEGNKNFLNEEFSFFEKDIESLIQHSMNGADEELVIGLLRNRDNLDFTTIQYLFERNPEYKFRNVEELLKHTSEYKETFMGNIQAFFDKSAVEKICNNTYINKNELLDYIAKHAEDREIINEIVNKCTIMKIGELDLLLGSKKASRAIQEWLATV